MTHVVAGMGLPTSVLNSYWFTVFATFVGVNTIIYLGLTCSKLLPWPRPVHPDRVRALLGRRKKGDLVAEPLVRSVGKDSVSESGILDIARALGWLGGVVLLIGAAKAITGGGHVADYVAMGTGLVFVAAAQILARRRVSTTAASWIWSVSIASLAVAEAFYASLGQTQRVGYVLVLAVILGAIALTWPSFLVAAAALLVSCIRIGSGVGGEGLVWIAPLAAALVAGAMVMSFRRRTLEALEEVDRRADELGTTDVLTGALTEEGLLTLGPAMASVARRGGEPLFVLLVQVEGLEAARRDYGEDYADDVHCFVADALRARAGDADLVGRWTGDDFVVMGIGSKERTDELRAGILRAEDDAPVTLGKRPLRLHAVAAEGTPDDLLADLVARAKTSAAGGQRALLEEVTGE